jgi:hypothetical protein
MIRLRHLNPFYARRLEKRFREIFALAHTLADLSQSVATDAQRMAEGDAEALRNGEKALLEAAAGIQNMRFTLGAIAANMATGRTTEAKALVDAMIVLLDRGSK